MSTALIVAVLWFASSVWVGFRDRSYAMPAGALCVTFSVDVAVTLGQYDRWLPAMPMWVLGILFVIPDFLLTYQVVAYGPADFPRISARAFRWTFFIALATGSGAAPVFSHGLQDTYGAYAATLTVLAVSVCYPAMLYNRGTLKGQSVTVASLWLLLAVTVPSAFLAAPARLHVTDRWLIGYMGAAAVVFSVLYLGAVLRMPSRR